MGKLKSQIKESFFNPVLLILPVLVFIILDFFSGLMYAWIGALSIAILLTVFVRVTYKNLFKWYLFYMLIFLVVISLMSVAYYFSKMHLLVSSIVANSVVFLVALLVVFLLRRSITKLSDKLVSPLIPMSNNIMEFYKLLKVFIVVVATYLLFYFILIHLNSDKNLQYVMLLNLAYLVITFITTLFFFIKVKIVRSQLANERWLPIITKEGKVVGTIQRVSSLSDRRKHMHPVIRGILVNEGRVLMQKPVEGDMFYKSSWDNIISRHINIGETAEESLKKAAFEKLNIEDLKSFYLTKYIHDTPYEKQYVLVFIICDYKGDMVPNPDKIAQMKWWTMPQIESNLKAGIFDDRFVTEYELLKRSGLLDSGEDICSCEPDEVVEQTQENKGKQRKTPKKASKPQAKAGKAKGAKNEKPETTGEG
ncbi:NUDIX domain-containing protein [Paludibacter sp. 221]|uniref:NUDIX domain-containing protein n=1 Tax=Paludibacter sp. 221 TaxID=2302939 RepID=UPI0013D63080|nr:NUDIX domain-containing protein [Paludibacter sp. 221]NDV46157.1 NUDIX domain-containing protein [Paludibacter sp. 221]